MAQSYEDMMGDEQSHPNTPDHNFRDRVQLAGEVQRLHPPGTFIKNTNSGDSVNTVAQELKVPPPNNVIKFPKK